jgi:hypothetical protein
MHIPLDFATPPHAQVPLRPLSFVHDTQKLEVKILLPLSITTPTESRTLPSPILRVFDQQRTFTHIISLCGLYVLRDLPSS